MTSEEKQKLAGFLDTAADFLGCGYQSASGEHQFMDDCVLFEETAMQNVPEDDSLEKIAHEISCCVNCFLCKARTNTVPGEGAAQPLVMVIGEGPGRDEDLQGRPFVGKAGQLLDKMLSSISLSRGKNAYIANTVKCRPPENRNPHPEEISACAHFLRRQIMVLKPKYILAAGAVSANALLNTGEGIGRLRGKFTEISVGEEKYPLIATYHPSALLRSEELKRPAWEDLKLLKARIDSQKES